MKKSFSFFSKLAICNVVSSDFNGGSLRLSDAWKVINTKLRETQANTPRPLSPNIGLLKYLLSPANNTSARFDIRDAKRIDMGDGRLYRVNRRFFPRQASGVHQGQTRNYCGVSGSSKPYRDSEVELGFDHVSTPLIIDDEMLRCVQEGRPEFVADRMLEHLRTYLNDLGVKVAKRVSTLANGYVGRRANETSVTVKDLPLFRDPATVAAVNPLGEAILAEDALEMEMSEMFNLVGGTLLDQYRKVKDIASGNDLGFDASLLEMQDAIWRDTNVSAHLAAGTDNVLAIRSGALQLVTFNRYAGDFAYKTEKQERTTMRDPFFGLLHDVLIVTEDCGDEVKRSMQFATIWDVVGYPSCWSDDPNLDGVTDVLAYKVICSDDSICSIPRAEGRDLPLNAIDPSCNIGNEPCAVSCCAQFTESLIGDTLYLDASSSAPAEGGVLNTFTWLFETGLTFSGAAGVPIPLLGWDGVTGTYDKPIINIAGANLTSSNVTLTIQGSLACADTLTKYIDLSGLRLRCTSYNRNWSGQDAAIWVDNTIISGGTANPFYKFTVESLLLGGVEQYPTIKPSTVVAVPIGVAYAVSEITGSLETQNVSDFINGLTPIVNANVRFYDNGQTYDYPNDLDLIIQMKRETIEGDGTTVSTTIYYSFKAGDGDYFDNSLTPYNAGFAGFRAIQGCVPVA